MQPAKRNVLTFGLVAVPVGVAAAARPRGGSGLRMVAPFEPGDERARPVSQRYLDPEDGTLYEQGELMRAYPAGLDARGDEVLVPVPGYEECAERLDSMEILGFVPEREADALLRRQYDSHYLQPQQGVTSRPLALLATAMRREKVVALVKFSLVAAERLGVVRPRPDGALMVHSIHFAADWRQPDAEATIPLGPVDREQLAQARELVRALIVPAAVADEQADASADRREAAIERALENAPAAAGAGVGDLTDLIRMSIEEASARA